jgi:hypothetical protein
MVSMIAYAGLRPVEDCTAAWSRIARIVSIVIGESGLNLHAGVLFGLVDGRPPTRESSCAEDARQAPQCLAESVPSRPSPAQAGGGNSSINIGVNSRSS